MTSRVDNVNSTVLTDQQREIVAHFTSHMPLGVRATYETKVIEMLNSPCQVYLPQREDDEAI
jgi:hypothetical protein